MLSHDVKIDCFFYCDYSLKVESRNTLKLHQGGEEKLHPVLVGAED
jgi:hypothetical protein